MVFNRIKQLLASGRELPLQHGSLCDGTSFKVRASLVIGACVTAASIVNASWRVGSLARRSIWSAPISSPPTARPLISKCLFLFGKILQQPCSRTRIFHRERQNGRANQRFIDALELGTRDSAIFARLLRTTLRRHLFSASLCTQCRHITRGDTTVIGHNDRQSTTGSLVDFSDDRLLVFESNCHWISPRFRRTYSQQTHHCPCGRLTVFGFRENVFTPSAQALL